MLRLFILLIFLSLLPPIAQSNAQEPVQEPLEIGDSGSEYLKSIRWRGINPEVSYFDPSAPPPNLDTKQEPERISTEREGQELSGRWTTGLIAAALLALVLYLFLRFGGGLAVSLKRDTENPMRGRAKGQAETPVWAERLGTLDEILRMRDRRRALILLAQTALAKTVAANGVLMQRSWTARDALRHIPATQQHLDDLRALVLASERVQFGGRDVTEDEFRRHADGCRTLLGTGAT